MKTNKFWTPDVKPHKKWRRGKEPHLIDASDGRSMVVILFGERIDGTFIGKALTPMPRRLAIETFEAGLKKGQLRHRLYKLIPPPVDEAVQERKRQKRAEPKARHTEESKSRRQAAATEERSNGIVSAIQRAITAHAKGSSKQAVKLIKDARAMKGKTVKDRIEIRALERKLGLRS